MLRKELLAGFVVAGFLMSDVRIAGGRICSSVVTESGRTGERRDRSVLASSPSSVRSQHPLAAALGARRRLRRVISFIFADS